MSVVLSEHLPLLASAPDGIKKLRGLILELAVRGKLVPQDSKDEPASELLKRIAAEKAQLVAEGKIRKDKPLIAVGEDEKPFELPAGWEWIRLGQIGDWGAGATPLRSNSRYYGGKIPWFKSGELTSDFISESEEHITELALKECSLRENKPGDVLIAMYGATIGKTAILSQPATTNQAVCACTPNSGVFNSYLLLLLKALKPNFIGQGAGGAQPNVSREKIIATATGLPPTSEQHRIVIKIDELMTLCDRMEAEQADAEAAHATLVQTLLGTLTLSRDAAELTANWQRLSQHFDTLFTTEASLDALKQTVLQLAVMGKLVPQNPKDEPASALLKRIAAEKARLVAEGKIRKDKLLTPVGEDEKPFELPTEWKWVPIAAVCAVVTDGDHLPPPKDDNGVPFLVIGDVRSGSIKPTEASRRVPRTYFDALDWTRKPHSGDVLLTTVGSYGIPVLVKTDEQFCFQRHIALLRPCLEPMQRWIHLVLGSPMMFSQLALIATGIAQKTVPLIGLRACKIPLPPLLEQHRIVAKVDELMALCDSLKADLAESRARQARLATTLIESALQAA